MIREFRPHSNRCRASLPSSWRAVATLLGVSLLAACSAPKPARVPQPRGQEAALIPATLHFSLSDGGVAPMRVWPSAGQPRAIILALHGFGDSRDAWEFSAPQLAAAGIETIAPDLRGFGETRSRGAWSSTARMVQDAREEALWIHARNPGIPLYVMGESMGGAVSTLLATDPPPETISGVILVSPAIWRFDPLSRLMLDGLDVIAPDWVFTGAHVPGEHIATNNLAALRRLYFDPLTLHGFRLDTLRGLVMLMASGQDAASRVQLPLLVLYGDQDQMIPAPPMAVFWKHLPPAARRDLIPGGHHLLLRDRNGRNATGDIASWVLTPDRLLPSSGDVAAAAWMAGDPGHFMP
ncbi:alpha/beta fold hydrolase [Asaia sp. HN010]|uniref:alpha/beta fold hydrolase n=1 Tax=Asaia sp. HN010 TaxID=3081233 RepID=UPI0030163775